MYLQLFFLFIIVYHVFRITENFRQWYDGSIELGYGLWCMFCNVAFIVTAAVFLLKRV
ncbi:hypothetical protein [Achromobacter phage Motura]|uniref:Uncharacterized protein n=1 Tax=Achromobacter phage Motura TaxID=2591403 RepID=A0A514CSP8_9CAUD|nr:hypothetical protein H1O15_gp298 [Achromobacter phage Motura]QDH83508.1 hypothetical protein [Achromobacter phage Motura]